MLAPWFPSAMLTGWNGKQQKRGFPPQKAGAWLLHSKTSSFSVPRTNFWILLGGGAGTPAISLDEDSRACYLKHGTSA
jgi:hypothetical protein